ncbi:MAG: hypothetical protein GY832_16155 [Chloroflexi bacterium]|nr:hypothetical protein [Chloroflexota bacterium]
MSDLIVGVGQSSNEDSFKAGQEAASQALQKQSEKPQVLIVFGAMHFDHRRLLAGVTSVTGDIPMVGGTTAGEISTSGFSTQSVVIMALGSNELDFMTGIGKNTSQGEAVCGIALVGHLTRALP